MHLYNGPKDQISPFLRPLLFLGTPCLQRLHRSVRVVCVIMVIAVLAVLSPKKVSAQGSWQDTIQQVFGTKLTKPGATKTPNLGNLWSRVEAHYKGITVKSAAIEAARLDQAAVKASALPNIKAQVQNTYGSFEKAYGGFFPLPGLFTVNGADHVDGGPSAVAATYGSTTLSWEVFAFGKYRIENEAAGSLVSKARYEKEAYLLALKKDLTDRYITLLYGKAKLDLALNNIARLNAVRLITVGLAKAGIRPAADSLLAFAAYMQAMADGDKWQGAKKAAYISLLELLTDTDTQEENKAIDSSSGAGEEYKEMGVGGRLIKESLSGSRFLPAGAVDTADKAEQALLSFSSTNKNVSPDHPVIASMENTTSYYHTRALALRRTALPSLNLLGGIAYRSSGIGADGVAAGKWLDGFHNGTHHLLAGIGITWDVTSIRIGKIKAAALSKTAEKTAKSQLQYQARLQATLDGLLASLQKEEMQLKKTQQAVTASGSAYSMYLARYKSGIISLTELLQIQQLLDQAELHHVEAARSFWLLQSQLAAISMDFSYLFNQL